MNSSTRKFPMLLGGLIVVALMAGACVSAGDPSVQVDAKAAELVFGVENPEDATAEDEANQIEYIDEIVAPITVELAAAPRRRPATPFRPFTGNDFDLPLYLDEPVRQRSTTCYASIRSPAPEQVLTPFVDRAAMEEGTYVWNGVRTVGPADQPKSVEALPTEARILRNITDLGPQTPASPESSYRFEVVQAAGEHPSGERQFLISTYVVNPRPPVDAVRLPSQVEQAARPPQARTLDSGVMLTRTELVDVNGLPFPDRPAFEPLVGVFLLPLPVSPGEKFNSAAVDPRSGKVVRVASTVLGETRLNACGEPVDGYEVEAFVSITTSAGSAGYVSRYVIAPQHGGLLLRETVEISPTPPVRAPQASTGEQQTQRICGTTTTTGPDPTTTTIATTTTTNPATTTTQPCDFPFDTQGQDVQPVIVPRQSTPDDEIVPGGEGDRDEAAYNIGFLEPEPDFLPLSEFP